MMVDKKILIAAVAIAIVAVAVVVVVADPFGDNDDDETAEKIIPPVSEIKIDDGTKSAATDVASRVLCRVDSGQDFTIALKTDVSGRTVSLAVCDTSVFSDGAKTTYADSWKAGTDGILSDSDYTMAGGSRTVAVPSDVLSKYNDGRHAVRLTIDGEVYMFTIAKPYSIYVWLDDGAGNTTKYTGTGTTIKTAVLGAINDHDVVFAANGQVATVDGKGAASGNRWVIFRWSSPENWITISDTKAECHEGMTLALRFSKTVKDEMGNTTYQAPDIEVKYKVYYFVRIQEEFESTEWLKNLGLSEDDKKAGFWIAGEGSTNNEALADAMIKAFYSDSNVEKRGGSTDEGKYIEYVIDGKEGFYKYGTKPDMYGWFLSFMGWSDTKKSSGGEYGVWTFWNQYSYNPSAKTDADTAYWDFNQWSFGMYDISKYRYFGLVLKTSEMEDSYIDLPTPSKIPSGL